MIALMMAAAVASFRVAVLSDRSKPVASAPAGEDAIRTEHVVAVASTDPRDAAFNRLMIARAREAQDDHYNNEDADGHQSFDMQDTAGSLDVGETVTAASPDLICVEVSDSYFEAGMAHPASDGVSHLAWSRRLGRLLTQADVFAAAPDRALRRLALSRFDNRGEIDPKEFKDGLPLDWHSASLGPDGITWSFGAYELGGYLSGGSATIGWAALRPYLRRDLPFAISSIRALAPAASR